MLGTPNFIADVRRGCPSPPDSTEDVIIEANRPGGGFDSRIIISEPKDRITKPDKLQEPDQIKSGEYLVLGGLYREDSAFDSRYKSVHSVS